MKLYNWVQRHTIACNTGLIAYGILTLVFSTMPFARNFAKGLLVIAVLCLFAELYKKDK